MQFVGDQHFFTTPDTRCSTLVGLECVPFGASAKHSKGCAEDANGNLGPYNHGTNNFGRNNTGGRGWGGVRGDGWGGRERRHSARWACALPARPLASDHAPPLFLPAGSGNNGRWNVGTGQRQQRIAGGGVLGVGGVMHGRRAACCWQHAASHAPHLLLPRQHWQQPNWRPQRGVQQRRDWQPRLLPLW